MNVIRSLLASCHHSSDAAQPRPDSAMPQGTVFSRHPEQASAAAAAPASQQIQAIPLHRLRSSNMVIQTYVPDLADDPLSIVAAYLSPTDQLVMRKVSPAIRAVVDTKITTLTLTAHEACALFAQSGDFSHVRTLQLLMCRDADLIRLSEILMSVRTKDIELILHAQAGCLLGAAGLRSLHTLSLANIRLQEIQITSQVVEALCAGTSPVSITLPYWRAGQAELNTISQIPTLASLHSERRLLPDDVVSSLRSHGHLSDVSVGEISANGFRNITSSVRLRTLSVEKIHGVEAEAFVDLAQNQVLKSLKVRRIHSDRSLMLLSQSRSLTSVELGLSAAACSGIPSLADMPILEHVCLVRIMSRGRLGTEHVEALCAKSLRSLSLHCWEMDIPAWALIAAASVRHLSLDFCDLNSDMIVNALAENRSIQSLSVLGEMINEGNALALARSTSLERLKVAFFSDRPEASEQRMKDAWRSAGKLLSGLDLRVSRIDLDAERDALTMPS